MNYAALIRRFCCTLLLLSCGASLQAQLDEADGRRSPTKPKRLFNIYAEIGGNGGVYSINYRTKIGLIKSQDMYWMAGISVLPRGSFVTFAVPASMNWYTPAGMKGGFILGTGQTLILSTGKGGFVRGTFRVAYRRHFTKIHCSMELAYTPFYSYLYNFQWDNWFGAGFAYHFMRTKK